MKEKFYKTFEEKLVKGVVDCLYNDEIGGRENHYYDTNELLPITEEELINQIVETLMKSKYTLWTESGYGLEPRHIRFIGKARIIEIVKHRVQFRHTKETWEWENQ